MEELNDGITGEIKDIEELKKKFTLGIDPDLMCIHLGLRQQLQTLKEAKAMQAQIEGKKP